MAKKAAAKKPEKKKLKARDYLEPWSTTKSKTWELGFKSGPPTHFKDEEELRAAVSEWTKRRDAAEENADWILWGSRVHEPGMTRSLLGKDVYFDDKGILTFVRNRALPEGAPTHEEMAKRVVECMNAMCGIGNPVEFMQELVAFLMDMSNDPIDDFFGGRANRFLFKVADHQSMVERAEEQHDH